MGYTNCTDIKTIGKRAFSDNSLLILSYPLLRIDKLFTQLNGGIKLSKIDLSDVYQQVQFTVQKNQLFSYWYTRLTFNIID